MDYKERIAGIGGLIEITKSKKGIAFIVTLIILFGGAVLDIEAELLIMAATSAWVYIGGQSYVDARKTVGDIRDNVIEEIELVVDKQKAA